jgi:hypothetical protein
MKPKTKRIEQQYEGQEHQFLDYEEAFVYFIYSFSWDISITWAGLKGDLLRGAKNQILEDGSLSRKGWRMRRLHERVLWDSGELGPTYQPTLVTRKYVMERTNSLGNLVLLIPVEEYSGINIGECRKLTVNAEYTVRLFENGGAVCTFIMHLPKGATNFENIHSVLHLAHNVDLGREPDGLQRHLTNAFIKLPSKKSRQSDLSLFPKQKGDSYATDSGKDFCSLHDLFRRLLNRRLSWVPTKESAFLSDGAIVDYDHLNQDFQSPFVFTAATIERNSFLRFRKSPTINTAREVGSILCKLTLDNRFIRSDFLHISEDYLFSFVPFNAKRQGLVNLCLDRRLFFSFSRRAALALTPSLADVPSYFVVPSLLNLCEILRVRWYMGSIVSAELDKAIAKIGGSTPGNGGKPLDVRQVIEEMFKWRTLGGAFLRDPIPFLFDGGSVSEIADLADRLLWLDHLRVEVTRKFDFLDKLVADYLNLERWRDFKFVDTE